MKGLVIFGNKQEHQIRKGHRKSLSPSDSRASLSCLSWRVGRLNSSDGVMSSAFLHTVHTLGPQQALHASSTIRKPVFWYSCVRVRICTCLCVSVGVYGEWMLRGMLVHRGHEAKQADGDLSE